MPWFQPPSLILHNWGKQGKGIKVYVQYYVNMETTNVPLQQKLAQFIETDKADNLVGS